MTRRFESNFKKFPRILSANIPLMKVDPENDFYAGRFGLAGAGSLHRVKNWRTDLNDSGYLATPTRNSIAQRKTKSCSASNLYRINV
jgi:hypothetical protein